LKVFVAWDQQWWADAWFNKDAYVVPVDGSSTEDQWRVFKEVHKDFPILQFTAVGSEAQRVRELSDQEVKAEIT